MQHTTETPKQYQCRHIFTDGRRCSSPCLRQEEFCYYHHTTRKPVANPKQRRSRCSAFHLPLPEDCSAIQSSIGEVLQRIASNDIDPRRAGLLLYGLQIASLNLPKPQPTPRNAKLEPVETANQIVEEITIDPTLGVLAPRAEVSELTQRKSSVALLIESMLQSEKEEEAANPGINEVAAAPVILPTLQAAAAEKSASLPQPAGSFVCHSVAQRRNLLLEGLRDDGGSAENGKLKSSADRNVVRIGEVVGFGDLGVLVGVAVEEQADGRKRVAGFDSDRLGCAAAGADLMLEIRVSGVDLLDRVPDAVGDDGGGNSAADVELFPGEVDGIEGRAVGDELLDHRDYRGVFLFQCFKICHGVTLLGQRG
jgi:hypothetical protein